MPRPEDDRHADAASEARCRAVFHHARDAMLLADDEARYVDVNPAACALLGYTREELLRLSVWDVTPPAALEASRAQWTTFLAGGQLAGEYAMLRKDGSLVPVEFNAVANVAPGLHLTVTRDASERLRQADLLHESEAQFRRVVENISDIITVIDGHGTVVFESPSVQRALGYQPAELLGRNVFDFVHTEDRPRVMLAFMSGGPDVLVRSYRFRHRDGSWRRLESIAQAYQADDGRRMAVVASRDLTDTERGYTESQLLQAVTWHVAEAPDLDAALAGVMRLACESFGWVCGEVWTMAPGGGALQLSPIWHCTDPRFESFREDSLAHGFAPGEGLPGQAWVARRPLWWPEVSDVPEFQRREAARRAGLRAAMALPVSLDDGETVEAVVVLYAAQVRAEDPGLLGLFSAVAAQLGSAMQRKRAEQALRSSQAIMQSVVTSAPIVVFAMDREGVFTLSEGAGLTGLGLRPGEFVGRSAFEVYSDVPDLLASLRRALAGEAFVATVEVQGRVFQSWYSPTLGPDDAVTAVLGVAIDITDRRYLEEQLRQAQKLESVGLLAGGIAHDFNNILTAITGYAELIREQLPPGDRLRADVAEITSAAEQAALLTYQLLAFSRKQLLRPATLNLNDVVTDVNRMLRRVIGEHIVLVARMGEGLGMVSADPGQIAQVIMNLAVNARDAMPAGGTLTIETANTELDDEYARNHEGVRPGPYVRLTVSDTGMGMSPDVQEHLFEPFFTTKGVGRGTGMGLATVYGIVKQSDGHIRVYSEVGRGSTFKVYLPRIATPAVSRPAGAEDRPMPRGREILLLVEDEELVRSLARRALEGCGYTVLEASDGQEALALYEQGSTVDLLITDVVMPRMSGREIVEQLSARGVSPRVLYMSGYTDDAIVHQGVREEGTHFLQKPFTMRALAHKVREVLDAPS
jgi:two-component system, cell cycle sensor histidine kinase and response regulator CckA